MPGRGPDRRPPAVDPAADPLATRPAPLPPEVRDRLRRWVRTWLQLAEDEPVTVAELAGRDGHGAPVETVLAVLRSGASLRSTVPLPADLVSVADVQRAFSPPSPRSPGALGDVRRRR